MTGERPLEGLRVVVTRARVQADALVESLEAVGATVELLPLIEVVPPADPEPLRRAVARLAGFEWIVFASANAVWSVAEELDGASRETAWPPTLRIAAVGASTADAVRAAGGSVDLVASDRTGAGLARDLAATGARGPVLVPRAADGRPELVDGLVEAGLEVVAVEAYDKRRPRGSRASAEALFAGDLGWVTFTSPRIARSFAALFGADWPRRRESLRALSIGPTTTAALEALGCERVLQAREPSVAALVEALVGSGPTRPSSDRPGG